ncbi:UNVERIFIED_CONTAM: hypothetical protein Sangu_1871700 [Sesamum angustifolium]|uniref:Uncharacterized protein n=1 Tax=Sesamum angustifolium TaxID=2727405 RepID=A0AAW2LVP7_9LAMI
MCTCGNCTCGCNETKIEQTEVSQLIQFLTGLNDSYDNIRNQILVLHSLPHVNKAFSMVLRVESQRQVNMSLIDIGDNSAFFGRGQEQQRGNNAGDFKHTMRKKLQLIREIYFVKFATSPDIARIIASNCMVYLTDARTLLNKEKKRELEDEAILLMKLKL